MKHRRLDSKTLTLGLSALGAVAFGVLSGCAPGDGHFDLDRGSEVDESEVASVRGSMVLKGAVASGSTKTIHYAPSDASGVRTLPFLAVEIVPSGMPSMTGRQTATTSAQSVKVSGPFPGTPRVLVVDEDLHVIAKTTAVHQPDGTALAELAAPLSAGRRFVLVRDNLWSREMSFQVDVGP